jgi:P pilus assembly chaperone PapD
LIGRAGGAGGYSLKLEVLLASLGLSVLVPLSPAAAGIAVSQMVIDMKPGEARATDIEIFNDSPERSFISVEPREITDPGSAKEKGVTSPDPGILGLLVSPNRLILEPRQRRRLRIAAIAQPADRERVYRVTVKPVAGNVRSADSGLKLLVGYDLLVLVRPAVARPGLTASRSSGKLVITNRGNSSVELMEGKQCEEGGKACRPLPAKRLYSGASWEQPIQGSGAVEYRVRSVEGWSTLKF